MTVQRCAARSNHAVPTSNGLVEACTWPSAYGVPTGPSTSRDVAVPGSGDVAGAPAAPMSAEGRGAQTGFSDAAWLATMTDNTEHVDVQPQRCSSSAAGASRLGGGAQQKSAPAPAFH